VGIKEFSKTRLRRDIIYSFDDLLGKRTPDTDCQIYKASRTSLLINTTANIQEVPPSNLCPQIGYHGSKISWVSSVLSGIWYQTVRATNETILKQKVG